MKIIFPILLLCSLFAPTVSAQNSSANPLLSIGTVIKPSQQTGNLNYLLSLSAQDFKTGNYVFYTDSNATIAHINVNGNSIRLTGGPNPEDIMVYTSQDYTVTMKAYNTDKTGINNDADDRKDLNVTATLAIYNKTGQVLVKKVAGCQLNAEKK